MILLRMRTYCVEGFRFEGQPFAEWPEWVQVCCTLQKNQQGHMELRHERPSGRQIVCMGEWLLRFPDGSVAWYLDNELKRDFEIVDTSPPPPRKERHA